MSSLLTRFFREVNAFARNHNLTYFVATFPRLQKFEVPADSEKVNLQKLCLMTTEEDTKTLNELLGKSEIGEFLNKLVEKHNMEVEAFQSLPQPPLLNLEEVPETPEVNPTQEHDVVPEVPKEVPKEA